MSNNSTLIWLKIVSEAYSVLSDDDVGPAAVGEGGDRGGAPCCGHRVGLQPLHSVLQTVDAAGENNW